WQPIEQYLNRQKTRYLRDRRGRPAHPLSSMFKAVLPGQWHSLSDPELEHSLITRIGFNLFCRFDEPGIPGCSTLCRYRKFRYARAAYFGLLKVGAQSHLKAMCLNLLKAANRLSAPAAA
ncbi:TPA: IS5 family transposase, partial [Neisseria gonorrhoeae]